MGDLADYYGRDGGGYYTDDSDVEGEDDDEYWMTKDKRKILIREMEDSHLNNTIAFLEKRGARAMLDVEEGKRDAISIAESLMAKLDLLTFDRYKFMLGERDRRKKRDAQVPAPIGTDPAGG